MGTLSMSSLSSSEDESFSESTDFCAWIGLEFYIFTQRFRIYALSPTGFPSPLLNDRYIFPIVSHPSLISLLTCILMTCVLFLCTSLDCPTAPHSVCSCCWEYRCKPGLIRRGLTWPCWPQFEQVKLTLLVTSGWSRYPVARENSCLFGSHITLQKLTVWDTVRMSYCFR